MTRFAARPPVQSRKRPSPPAPPPPRPVAAFPSLAPQLAAIQRPKVHVFVQWYVPRHADRAREVNFCVRRLLANLEIDHISLMVPEQDRPRLPAEFRRKGVEIVPLGIGSRIYFSDAMRRAADADTVYMVLNSDIVVPEKAVAQMRDYLSAAGPARSICLSRYESSMSGLEAQLLRPRDAHVPSANHCHDLWAFRGGPHITGLAAAAHFPLGLIGCDGRIACLLHGVTHVVNPCKDVRTYHIHGSGYRTWHGQKKIPGQWAKVPAARLLYAGRSQAHL
jgi:hypothetical protein